MVKRQETVNKEDGVLFFFPPRCSTDLGEQLKVHQTREYSKKVTGLLLLHTALSVRL